jgi:hypothetical protein
LEGGVSLLRGHLQDGASFGLDPPLLRSGADGLAGELGDGSGIAVINQVEDGAERDEERVSSFVVAWLLLQGSL